MLAPGTNVGRYVVQSVLGEGGMAVVYRVTQEQLGTTFALKVLTLNRTDIRERFVQEGKLQAGLRHPNIVSVFDLVDVEGSPGLLLEFVDGQSLSERIGKGPIPLDEAESIFRGVVAGVSTAHRHGIVHRDLKPGNVLLTMVDGQPIPKVADFGLAKIAEAEGGATRTGTTMGTPSYMAPEQIRDAKHVDARADVFALGAILYELVTGKQAFPGDDILTVMTAVSAGDYPPPMPLVPGLPARFATTIEGALRTDPAQRIPSCEALLATLRDETLPSTRYVPPPAKVTRTSSSTRAAPIAAMVIAGAVVFVTTLVLIIGGGALLTRSFGDGATVPTPLATVDPRAPCGGKDGAVVGYVNHRGILLKRKGATWVLPSDKDVYSHPPGDGKPDPTEADVVCHLPASTKVKLVENPLLVSGQGAWAAIAEGNYTVPAPEPTPVQPPPP